MAVAVEVGIGGSLIILKLVRRQGHDVLGHRVVHVEGGHHVGDVVIAVGFQEVAFQHQRVLLVDEGRFLGQRRAQGKILEFAFGGMEGDDVVFVAVHEEAFQVPGIAGRQVMAAGAIVDGAVAAAQGAANAYSRRLVEGVDTGNEDEPRAIYAAEIVLTVSQGDEIELVTPGDRHLVLIQCDRTDFIWMQAVATAAGVEAATGVPELELGRATEGDVFQCGQVVEELDAIPAIEHDVFDCQHDKLGAVQGDDVSIKRVESAIAIEISVDAGDRSQAGLAVHAHDIVAAIVVSVVGGQAMAETG